jgi:hypothetical protein
MKTVADVKCYHCGHISGEATLAAGSQTVVTAFHPAAGNCTSPSAVQQGHLRCCRCGGPVFLDETRVVRPLPVLTLEDLKPRRGRPRKADVLAREAKLAALSQAS